MKIKTPLVLEEGTILYPNGKSFWSEAVKEGSFLVGFYSGDLYDEDGVKTFDWEEYVTTPDYGTILTNLAFRRRFKQEERAMIDFLSLDVPTDPIATRLRAAAFRQSLVDVNTAAYIDLSLQETRDDTYLVFKALEEATVIDNAQQRFIEVMDTPPTWKELPLFVQARYTSV